MGRTFNMFLSIHSLIANKYYKYLSKKLRYCNNELHYFKKEN